MLNVQDALMRLMDPPPLQGDRLGNLLAAVRALADDGIQVRGSHAINGARVPFAWFGCRQDRNRQVMVGVR